jgi:hypothetical protein
LAQAARRKRARTLVARLRRPAIGIGTDRNAHAALNGKADARRSPQAQQVLGAVATRPGFPFLAPQLPPATACRRRAEPACLPRWRGPTSQGGIAGRGLYSERESVTPSRALVVGSARHGYVGSGRPCSSDQLIARCRAGAGSWHCPVPGPQGPRLCHRTRVRAFSSVSLGPGRRLGWP